MIPAWEVEVRSAHDPDLRSIVAHYGPGGGDSPWDPFAALERIQRIPREGLLVAVLGNRYAGFLYWYEGRKPWYDPSVERFARISDLHVLPEFQGKGVGRALLREALRRIEEKAVPVIYLETDEDNERARALYETAGFSQFARVVRYRLSVETRP